MVGFGTEAIDFDGDGWHELVVANGHVDPPTRAQDSPYRQPLQVFGHVAANRYELLPRAPDSYAATDHVARALLSADVNGDLRDDLLITHQTEPVALLINQSPDQNHRIAFRLVGVHCAREAIGTRVTVRRGGRRWTESLTAGSGYLCHNERVLRLGLGGDDQPVDVTILWPGGREQTHRRLSPDRSWLLVEDQPPFELD